MKKLIIISDLWGGVNPNYIERYKRILEHQFEIKYYDACDLAEIDLSDLSEQHIHQQFIRGGVELAAEKLFRNEKNKLTVIGFSIGGFIAWKAIQKGLKCDQLYAISATRLRHEKTGLNCPTKLIYGELDPFKPNSNWFQQMNINPQILEKEKHELYKNESIARSICNALLNNFIV